MAESVFATLEFVMLPHSLSSLESLWVKNYVIHLNIRSLPNKIDLLRAWLSYNNPMVITLSETWLSSNICDEDLKLDNYILYIADRGTRGGRVATYFSSQ